MPKRNRLLDGFAAVVIIALALVILNRVSTAWTVRRLSSRALERIAYDARGRTPWIWDMDSREDLDLGPSSGLRPISMEKGALELESIDEDPYLFLDLGRTNVPAADFPVFHARWVFSDRTPVQLHFWEPGNPEPRASAFITMPPGSLSFRWDLREVDFERVIPAAVGSSRWGGDSGRVGRFRIDLGESPGLLVRIETLSLERPPGTRLWIKEAEDLALFLDSGREVPELDASQLFSRARAPVGGGWARVVFSPDSRPPNAPERLQPGPAPVSLYGSLKWPFAPPTETAVKIARGWKGRLRFFEARNPWATPESVLTWIDEWERADTPPIVPRRLRAGDLPVATPESFPGKEKGGEGLEPLCWAVFAGALLFFALLVPARAAGLAKRIRGFGLIETGGIWAALLAAIVVFNRAGSDPRALAVLWAGFIMILLSVVRIGDRACEGVSPGGFSGRLAPALEALGLKDWKHRQAAYAALGITAVGFVGLFGLGDLFGALRFKPAIMWQLPEYVLKGLVQQVLLCPFLASRFESTFGGRRNTAAALSAALFSALHVPNFTLTASTLIMGFLWASIYLKHRRLGPLVISHAILGTALSSLWVSPLLVSHRVGAMFFLR